MFNFKFLHYKEEYGYEILLPCIFIKPCNRVIFRILEFNLLDWRPGVTYDFDVTFLHNTLISEIFQMWLQMLNNE